MGNETDIISSFISFFSLQESIIIEFDGENESFRECPFFVLCYRKNEVEVKEMLKLRLQGTKNEIRWFIRLLQREPRVDLENTSTFFSNKGTERYKRLYTQVNRVDAKSKSAKKKSEDSEKDTYCGSGRTFC